jgi:CRP/FNR family cyclic AMP-dependent transcriptional regulator
MADLRIRRKVQSCLECISRKNCLFSTPDDLPINELEKAAIRTTCHKGDILFIEGEEVQGIYFVCSGLVRLSLYSSERQAVTVALAIPGDVLGLKALLSGKPHNLTAEVAEPSQLCRIRRDDFSDFLERNGDVSLRLSQKLANYLYDAHLRMRELTKQSHTRLVDLLLRLSRSRSKPSEKGTSYRINISQDELAEEIGTSRRNLSRALKDLKEKRIIECRRRTIKVIDRVALEKLLPTENLF